MDNAKPREEKPLGVTRRQFIETASMAALGTTLASNKMKASAPPSRPPNILLIISDEHNASVTGCYGNRTVLTPYLDELASRSVVFENCYTNSPLCVPSRLSITSGKYCSRVGGWSNSCWLPNADYPSIARVVGSRGYESYLVGKMHYDRTRRYGFTEIGHSFTNEVTKTGKGGGVLLMTHGSTTPTGGAARAIFIPGNTRKCLTTTVTCGKAPVTFWPTGKPARSLSFSWLVFSPHISL